MACVHPIFIRNRKFYPSGADSPSYSPDAVLSTLSLEPWEFTRGYLVVPCGNCPECLRALRNSWFVRLSQELKYCRDHYISASFVTITISPKYYELALANPSLFIRKWFERVRHVTGRTIKHALFQEFGEHPFSPDSGPRLHFHGFLYGIGMSYNTLRSIVSDFGYIWIGKGSSRRARYVVKYVVKQIKYNGDNEHLRKLLTHRKYTRKFISPGVGNYLGNRRAPSFSVRTWNYHDFKNGTTFTYNIPRYYDRFLTEKDKFFRAVSSAFSYSLVQCSSLANHVFAKLAELPFFAPALARKTTYVQRLRTMIKMGSCASSVAVQRFVVPPKDFSLVSSVWSELYGIDIPFFKYLNYYYSYG